MVCLRDRVGSLLSIHSALTFGGGGKLVNVCVRSNL